VAKQKKSNAVGKEPELKEGEKYRLTTEPLKEGKKKEHYAELSLKSELKEKIANIIMEQVESAEVNADRQAFIEHCEYCRKRYTMEDLDTDWPWEGASKRRTGGSTIAVDRLKPRIKKALFYSGQIVDVLPAGNNTDENASRQGKWINSTLRNEMKLEENSNNVLYDAIMLNFGVLKMPWVFEDEKREEVVTYETADELLRNHPDALAKYPQYILKLTGYESLGELAQVNPYFQNLPVAKDKNGENIKIVVRESYRDTFAGIRPEWVDPQDIIFPEGVDDDEKSWIIIQHLKMRRDELLRKKKNGFFDFNEEELFGTQSENEDYGKKYDVYEAILRYDIDKDDLEEKCVYWVSAGDSGKNLYLRGIKYPYTHNQSYFVLVRSTDHRYGFYTGGLGQKLESVNESEDRRVNQISNAWDQAIVKAWKHVQVPGSPYNPRIHKYYPGADIPVGDANELIEMSMGDIPNSSFTLLEDNRRESELLSGVTSSLMSGQITPRDPSAPARKAELLLAESNISISEYLKNIIPSIKKIAYQTQMNYYQFTDMTEEMNYRVEKGFENITKEQMRGKLMFVCRSAVESVVAEQKAQSNLALLSALSNYPMVAQNYVFQWYLVKNIVENWSEDLARNIDKLFSPELKDLIETQLKQAQALAQQKAQQERMVKEMRDRGMSREEIQVALQGAESGGGRGAEQGARI